MIHIQSQSRFFEIVLYMPTGKILTLGNESLVTWPRSLISFFSQHLLYPPCLYQPPPLDIIGRELGESDKFLHRKIAHRTVCILREGQGEGSVQPKERAFEVIEQK